MAKSSTILSINKPEEGCDQLLWCPGVQSLLNPQVLSEPRAIPTVQGGQSAQTDSGWDPRSPKVEIFGSDASLNKRISHELIPPAHPFVHSQKQSLGAVSSKFCPSSAQQCAFTSHMAASP